MSHADDTMSSEQTALKLSQGSDALLERFDAGNIRDDIDLRRRNVATKRSSGCFEPCLPTSL